MKWDWTSVFPAGSGLNNPHAADRATDYCGNGNYSLYEYRDASIEGSTTLREESAGPWPITPTGTTCASSWTTATRGRPCRRRSRSSSP